MTKRHIPAITSRWLIKIATALVLIAPFATTQSALADINVAIAPDTTCTSQNDLFTVAINLTETASPFHGYETVLRYDPALIEYVSIAESPLMTNLCFNTWWFHEAGDSTIFISHVVLCGGDAIRGPGDLSTVTFRALSAEATGDITFDYIEFYLAGELVTPVTATPGAFIIRENCESACCFSDASCLVLDRQDCDNAAGHWIASIPACDPNPCLYMDVTDPPSPEMDPIGLSFHQCPAFHSATLEFMLSKPGFLQIDVFDPAGRLVRDLYEGYKPAGIGLIHWDGTSNSGSPVGGGIYLFRLTREKQVATGRLIMIQ
jgi:Cohesin domain/FlgD Ig-like domain